MAALCDLGYSIYQGVSSDSEDEVAYFQYMSPAVIVVSMVSLASSISVETLKV